jgi:hypothetical protein
MIGTKHWLMLSSRCAGRAVHDDPIVSPAMASDYAGRALSTESKVSRHIVCLTFDFDTQSGFHRPRHDDADAASAGNSARGARRTWPR